MQIMIQGTFTEPQLKKEMKDEKECRHKLGRTHKVKIFGEMLDKPESLDSDAYMLSRAYDFTFPKWDNRRLK